MGINLTPCATITSSSYIDPYEPLRTVDGNVSDCTSRWLCGNLPGWIIYDLKAPFWVSQWSLRSIGGWAGWPADYCMTSFALQYSPTGAANTWKTVDSVAHNNALTYVQTFAPVYARFWRVYVPSGGGLQANLAAASIMEVQLIQAEPTPNTLTSLVLKDASGADVAINPVFVPFINTYTATVPFGTSTVTLTPTAADARDVTLTVNGVEVSSGGCEAIYLKEGATTTIPVVVTPRSSIEPNIYTINVTRLESTRLKSLILKDQTGADISMTPSPFASGTLLYTANVVYGTQSVTLTPTKEGANATITVDGQPVANNAQSQAIPLTVNTPKAVNVVVSSNGTPSTTYVVNATRPGSANLTNLVVTSTSDNSAVLAPSFNTVVLSYDFVVTSSLSSAAVKFVPSLPAGCTATINGLRLIGGARIINVSNFPTVIPVVATNSSTGESVTYNVTVKK